MRRTIAVFCAAAAVGLSGCQALDQQASLGPSGPQGVEGRWASTSGPVAYTATFRNGRFTSIEDGTNGILASGSYTDIGPGQVSILYTSNTRGEQIAANCNQVSPDRLSCATSSGSRFDLTRV